MIEENEKIALNRELHTLIEIIEKGNTSFLGFITAIDSGQKLKNEEVGLGLVMNYSFDFTEKLIHILQLLNIHFKPFLREYNYDSMQLTIIDGKSVISELTNHNINILEKMIQAKKYISIANQDWDFYINQLDFYSKLLEKNFLNLKFL